MKNIKDYCVPYSIAIILKQKQFDYLSFCNYNPNGVLFWKFASASEDEDYTISIYDIINKQPEDYIEAPTYEQVISWLDEKHKIRVDLTHADSNGNYKYTIWRWNYDNNIGKWEKIDYINSFYDKNERNKKAIEAALKII